MELPDRALHNKGRRGACPANQGQHGTETVLCPQTAGRNHVFREVWSSTRFLTTVRFVPGPRPGTSPGERDGRKRKRRQSVVPVTTVVVGSVATEWVAA